MKTIEEKAKAYDEAIEKFEVILNLNTVKESGTIFADDVRKILPELKELEGERIREWLIALIKSNEYGPISNVGEMPCPKPNVIEWLEKQGEQKVANNVTPRFKVGDWVVFNNKHQSIYQVEKIEDGYYILRHTHGGSFRECVLHDESLRLWTIQDAKDGDVLVNGSNIFIFHFINDTRLMGYCHVNTDDGRFYDDIGRNECFCLIDAVVNPAAKEQRDTLEKAMAEDGYAFDFNKKELKVIDFSKHLKYNPDAPSITERNPAWSEEDEEMLENVIFSINHESVIEGLKSRGISYSLDSSTHLMKNLIDWLKSLKDRVQPQQEWSEEDETVLDNLIYALANDRIGNDRDEYVDWLKSLKDRYTWKPSVEQMEALAWALSLAKNCGEECAFDLRTLQDQLKKLREE